MKVYEVYVEDINPCGGEKHSKKEFMEVRCEDPEKYVQENGRFPIMEVNENADGDLVIMTGDGSGNAVRYTFSE